MDAYLDLSYFYSVVSILTMPYFFKRIIKVKLTLLEVLSLIIFNIVLYFNAFLFYSYKSLNLLFLMGYFLILYRKKFIKYFFLYLLVYYSNASYGIMLSNNINLYNGVVLISSPLTFLLVITNIVNIIVIELIMLTIRSIKLLKCYRFKIELEIDKYKYFINGYMDSGNTLIKDELPVIFISEDYLKDIEYNEMIVSGVGIRKCKYSKGKIKINDQYKNVICAFVDNMSFKGCECLLNINLMEES